MSCAGEAQRMVDAAIASARQQLANLQFRFEETGIPYGFEAFTGPLGSSQVISVPSNANQDYVMRNDEWSLQVRIDKRDSETGNQIAAECVLLRCLSGIRYCSDIPLWRVQSVYG